MINGGDNKGEKNKPKKVGSDSGFLLLFCLILLLVVPVAWGAKSDKHTSCR